MPRRLTPRRPIDALSELQRLSDQHSRAARDARRAIEAADQAEANYRAAISRYLNHRDHHVRKLARALAVPLGVITSAAELAELVAGEEAHS